MKMKSSMFVRLAVAAVGVFGALAVSAVVIDKKPVVTRGVWNSNFDVVLEYARGAHVPMLLYHGRTSCPHCVELKTCLGKPDFTEWQAKRRFAMCLNLDAKSKAKEFSATGVSFPSGEAQSLNTVPRVSVYWLKPNGEEVHVSFKGGSPAFMPVKGANLEMSVADSVDAVLAAAGYVDETPSAFRCGDVEGNRLEAEPTTAYVDVGIVRTRGETAVTEQLQIDYPAELGRASVTKAVGWTVGETEKSVRVEVPPAEVGSRIGLTLIDKDGNAVAVSHITYVGAVVRSANPLWIGERTAETLQPGEWTMDFDLAIAAAARQTGDAFTLVLVEGALWSSNTALTAANLLDREDFLNWASEHKAYLVAVDVPESADGVSLLSQGGAGYMSRKMIDEKAAGEIAARNAQLAADLLRPESERTDRPDVPALVLLDKAGAVRGRIELFASSAPSVPAAGYLMRLDELLAAADDPEEERNAHWLTAEQEVPATGAFGATLSGADLCDVVRLSGVAPDTRQRADVSFLDGDPERICELSLVELRERTATVVETAVGRVGDGLSLSAPILTKSAAYCLRLRVADLSDAAAFGNPSNLTVRYEVKLSSEPLGAADAFAGGASTPFSATIPLMAGIDLKGLTVVVGQLSVSGTKTGKVSAKFTGTESKAVKFSGSWQSADAAGCRHALLDGRNGERLYLTRTADGRLSALLADAASRFAGDGADTLFVGTGAESAADGLGDFAGLYNVALESDGGSSGLAGHAYLQLKFMSASALKKGQASVSGLMPDGKAFSGKAFVTKGPDGLAEVTLFKRVASGVISAAFSLAKPDVPRTIDALPAIRSAFVPTAKGLDSPVTTYRARGCAFPADLKPAALCERFAVGPDLTVYAEDEAVVTVTAEEKKFVAGPGEKVSYAPRTGIFSGKTNVLQSDGRLASGTFKCMFIPGWGGDPQGAPVGFGTLSYKEKVDGKSVTKSRPVELR